LIGHSTFTLIRRRALFGVKLIDLSGLVHNLNVVTVGVEYPLRRVPFSRCSIRTVVSGGETRSTSGMSLCPTTEISSGQRRPSIRIASAVVMAKWEGELDHARMQAVLNGDVPADDALSEAAMEPVRAQVRT